MGFLTYSKFLAASGAVAGMVAVTTPPIKDMVPDTQNWTIVGILGMVLVYVFLVTIPSLVRSVNKLTESILTINEANNNTNSQIAKENRDAYERMNFATNETMRAITKQCVEHRAEENHK